MELRDYLRGLRRHWIAILLMTLVGVGAGYGWTLLQTPVYVAGASGYVSSTGVEDLGTSTLGDSLASRRCRPTSRSPDGAPSPTTPSRNSG